MRNYGVNQLAKEGKAFKENNIWYLAEDFFNHLIESHKSLNDIVAELGIHRRVWYASLERYGNHRWKALESSRRSHKMRGNQNGLHPPSVLIPREELVNRLERGEPAVRLMMEYRISERLFHRNLDYYGLSEWFRRLQEWRLPYRLMEDPTRMGLLKMAFPDAFQAIQQSHPSETSLEAIRGAQIALLDLAYWVKEIGRRLKYRLEIRTGQRSWVVFTANRGECLVERELCYRHFRYIPQYSISDGDRDYYYDFFLPDYHAIIEVDGSVHYKRNPRHRDALRRVQREDTTKQSLAEAYDIKVYRVTFTHEKNRNRLLDELDIVLAEIVQQHDTG